RTGRVSFAVLAAARPANSRSRRVPAATGGIRSDSGRGWACMLRLRGNVLDLAAEAVAAIALAQDRGARSGRARRDRNGEHRLPRAPARRNPAPGPALDRTAR